MNLKQSCYIYNVNAYFNLVFHQPCKTCSDKEEMTFTLIQLNNTIYQYNLK